MTSLEESERLTGLRDRQRGAELRALHKLLEEQMGITEKLPLLLDEKK